MKLAADRTHRDRMVALVEQMLAAKKQLAGAQSDKDKYFYTNCCNGLPRDGVLRRPSRGAALRDLPCGETLRGQIDALGDVLYALTPAEIKIVEGNRS
jgi:hypothetical protein